MSNNKDIFKESFFSQKRTEKAGQQVLEMAVEMHLTVRELERAFEYVKGNAYLSGENISE